MQTTHSVLSASNLSIGYHSGNNAVTVMQGINLQLHSSRLTAMLGRNGIGKSTLLRTIAGAQPAIEGTVQLGGRNIGSYRPRELSRQMSLVYTDRTQAGGLTVRQLVSLGRYPHTGFFGRLGKHDRNVVTQSMAAAGIAHKETAFVAELSDGERQKAMIARALAQETPIMLLDEPTSLDVCSRRAERHNIRHRTRQLRDSITGHSRLHATRRQSHPSALDSQRIAAQWHRRHWRCRYHHRQHPHRHHPDIAAHHPLHLNSRIARRHNTIIKVRPMPHLHNNLLYYLTVISQALSQPCHRW